MNAIEALKKIEWFSSVGHGLPTYSFRVKEVLDWREAIETCTDPCWEDVCTEAQNDLTKHLNLVCKLQFQNWNRVVNSAKRELAESWHRLRQKLEIQNLPTIIAECAEWDTMHAAACEYYAEWNPPQFFMQMLSIYRSGHFPCGWDGNWPEGQVRAY